MKLMAVLVLVLCAFVGAYGQTISGTIVGTVVDPSGLSIANANVTLTNSRTGAQRNTQANADGFFTFNVVEPGVYDVVVEAAGFKKLQRTSLNLSASDRLAVGKLALEVGNMNESVTIQAEGAAVQTASSERSGVITSAQMENLMIKGRNVVSMLQLLPGVVDTNNPDGPDRNFAIGLWVNGERRNSLGMWLDGVPTQDSGTQWISTLNPRCPRSRC